MNPAANTIAITPTMHARNTLCLIVKRNSLPSSAVVSPVAATATAMLWSEIIFPITPAAEFTEAVRMGFRPSALAVITWRLPKSAFDEVSLPVRNTPSQPRIALKNGKATPVVARARPSVEVIPE